MKFGTLSSHLKAAACGVLLLASSFASAELVTIDVDNQSFDGFDSSMNDIISVDLAAALELDTGSALEIIAFGWDLTIATISPSYLSEAAIDIGDSETGYQVTLTPGIGDDFSGTMSYASDGLLDLVDLDLVISLGDGVMLAQFYESFDDFANAVDATVTGTFTVDVVAPQTAEPVSTPATLGLLGLALAALGFARRQR